VKYGKEKEKRNEVAKDDSSSPRENSPSKSTTFTTSTTKKALDTDLDGSVLVVQPPKVVVKISEVVKEFLADGGQSSLQRFLAEFPEAAGGSV
jgi:hypothetical protein